MPKKTKNEKRSLSALIGAGMLVVAAGKYFFSVVLSEKMIDKNKEKDEKES